MIAALISSILSAIVASVFSFVLFIIFVILVLVGLTFVGVSFPLIPLFILSSVVITVLYYNYKPVEKIVDKSFNMSKDVAKKITKPVKRLIMKK